MSRALTKIIGLTFLVQTVIFAMGILNNVLLSRWLGPASLGIVVLFFQISELIYKFTNLGMETSTLYYISNRRFPFKKIMGNIFTNAFFILGFSAFATVLFFKIGGFRWFFNTKNSSVQLNDAWWCIFLIFAYLVFEYGTKILLGLQRFIKYNKILLLRPIVLFILIITCFYLWGLSIASVLIIYSISWLIPGLLMWQPGLPFRPRWDKKITREFLRYGLKIMMTNMVTFLIYRADILLIGYFWSSELVGWYYVAMIIAEKLQYMSQPTSTILFPAASYSSEQQKKTPIFARVNFVLILVGAIILAIIAPWIIPALFSEQYQNSVIPLIILLPGIVALTLPKVLSADLAAKGLPHVSMYITFIIAVVNVILNIILIPKIGIIGASISSTISYSMAAILISYFYKRITGIPIRELLIPRFSDWQALKKI